MRIQILGPISAWRDHEPLDLGPAAQRALLGLLTIVCGQPLSHAELLAAVWPDRLPPPTARNVIQTHVKHLRSILEPDRRRRAPSKILRQVGDGYALHVPGAAVDVVRFRHQVTAATGLAHRGEINGAADLLGQSLALWNGSPLADIPALTAHPKVVALAAERQAVLDRYGDMMIAAGRAGEALPVLEEAAAAQPLDESAQARLIRAYHAAGRRSRAFSRYHQVRRLLTEELGVGPGPQLTTAHTALLRDEAPAAAPAEPGPATVPAASTEAAGGAFVVPAQLPADIPDFTGRGAELRHLDRLLAERPGPTSAGAAPAALVAVSGTAGVGKTALAVRWAHRVRSWFPDGQLYVDLRGHDADPPVAARQALAGFLRGLGVAGADHPPGTEERAAAYRSRMDGRRMLVVLDNAVSAEQIRPLLPGSPSCFVLVTSRDSLAALVARHGARRIELDVLPQDDAVVLIRRLTDPRLTNEPGATAALAVQCARLPLALRLAAEMTDSRPGTPLTELVQELADQRHRLDLLDAGGDRRTGVRAVLSWSYRRLPADAARAFRLLGRDCEPDVEPQVAAGILGTTVAEAWRLLDLLARAHLLQRGPGCRYGMHALLRAYAVHLVETEHAHTERPAAIGLPG
ncbi:AfsR/SARP family transcriptional regulator [Salinispora fenicalii]|uniref:AfsR/SARP family transcriptional regulator n=1 Tax=Salinispora fenicalii TaxID=1137263 RepID=UPI000480BE44|nr:AfsR/SARP family transcriptional regulator [Salinispora fenicalii]